MTHIPEELIIHMNEKNRDTRVHEFTGRLTELIIKNFNSGDDDFSSLKFNSMKLLCRDGKLRESRTAFVVTITMYPDLHPHIMIDPDMIEGNDEQHFTLHEDIFDKFRCKMMTHGIYVDRKGLSLFYDEYNTYIKSMIFSMIKTE